MKIAIMSDSHDHWENLEQAITIAEDKDCQEIWFAGDLISPTGILIFKKFSGTVRFVLGNNEAELLGIADKIAQADNVFMPEPKPASIAQGLVFEEEVGGLKFFMNHYQKFGEIAAKSGDYDVVIYGHDHIYNESKINKTLCLNPGEIHGQKSGTATFMVLNTEDKSVEKITL